MKERPIIFSGPMVRALLAGIKTQTRRVLKPQPTDLDHRHSVTTPDNLATAVASANKARGPRAPATVCPYGVPGDCLRVRETFFAYGRWGTRYSNTRQREEWHFVDMTIECGMSYRYAEAGADFALSTRGDAAASWHKRPAIFMPRVASRIVLENTSIRIERLNDCSVQDAVAEGIGFDPGFIELRTRDDKHPSSAIASYRRVWESINGIGSWEQNPWVWVVEFRRMVLEA